MPVDMNVLMHHNITVFQFHTRYSDRLIKENEVFKGYSEPNAHCLHNGSKQCLDRFNWYTGAVSLTDSTRFSYNWLKMLVFVCSCVSMLMCLFSHVLILICSCLCMLKVIQSDAVTQSLSFTSHLLPFFLISSLLSYIIFTFLTFCCLPFWEHLYL